MDFLTSLMAFTIWGSFVWFSIIAAIVIILFFVSEVNENGFLATGAFIVFCILFFSWGSITYKEVWDLISWPLIGTYLGIGIIYSFIRAFFYARRKTKEYLERDYMYKYSENEKNDKKHELDIDLRNHLTRWWLLWPVSMLTLIFTDFVKEIMDFVYKILKRVYDSILELGIKSVSDKVILKK